MVSLTRQSLTCMKNKQGDMAEEIIRVRGARVHNLKSINVEIPINQLTVITGVSAWKGKSSTSIWRR